MSKEVTQILCALESGDRQVAAQLLPLVYDELRRLATSKMAQENSGHTLQPTALVHEAFLRLIGSENSSSWDGRAHFFGAAAGVESSSPRNRCFAGGSKTRPQPPNPRINL